MWNYCAENESEIIAAALQNDAKAQKKIYEFYAPRMLSVCFRYMNNMETAKDMLQDGFVRVICKLHMYNGTGSFEGWMRRVFTTTCLEFLRKKDALRLSASIEDVMQPMVDTSTDVISQISADELMEMMCKLADGYRTIFNLYVVEGYSHAEIAQMLNISEITSRTQFLRARKGLQEMIEKAYGK